MDKEAIEKIQELVQNSQIVTAGDGKQYSAMRMNPVQYVPKTDPINIASLKGFCDYLNNNFDVAASEKKKLLMVIVEDVDNVQLVSEMNKTDHERECLVNACVDSEMKTFPFGSFMPQEEFAIRFRSSFVEKDGDDTQYVLSFTSSLAGGIQVETSDDGVTQNVGVKKGVKGNLSEKQKAKSIVKLSPYRTFREINQPESQFLFRVRLDSDNMPTVALFEADGSAWRNEAKEEIQDYIADKCGDVSIIA